MNIEEAEALADKQNKAWGEIRRLDPFTSAALTMLGTVGSVLFFCFIASVDPRNNEVEILVVGVAAAAIRYFYVNNAKNK